MRTVWGPATRPKLSSFAAPRASAKSIAARRAAAANASRQIAACDVFALFLGPVLAAAAFADVSWKERKRKEWEQRFAEINAQLEELRAREVEVWRRIQYHSVRHGVLQHRRMYSTAVATPAPDPEPVVGDCVNMHIFDSADQTDLSANWDRDSFPIRSLESNPAPLDSLGDLPVDAPQIRYEKLLALRLALRMLLHICAGSDDLRVRELQNQRPNVSAEDIGGVVVRLQAVTDELDKSDHRWGALRRKKAFRHDSPESQADNDLWRTELHQVGQLYRDKQIDVVELVDRLSKLLLPPDRKPPGPEFYARLTLLFSINNLPELAKYAISALESTSYVLSETDICLMLNHSSHSRDYKAYEWVIHHLTDANGVLASEGSRWRWVRLSGKLLPMPRDEQPALMRGLIRAALNFNNPRTAETYAYHVPWMQSGPMRGFTIKAFLQYFAKVGDWKGGKRWLREANRWIRKRRDATHPALRAVFVRVFDFLIAFRLNEDFQILLSAVVGAGIEPPEVDPHTRESSERLLHIVKCWREQINLRHSSGERFTNLDHVTETFGQLIEGLWAKNSSPRHLKESIAAEDQPNVDVGEEAVPTEKSTPSGSALAPENSMPKPNEPTLRLDSATVEVESREELGPANVDRSDVEKLLELNSLQQQEFHDIHNKQRMVIELQEQKLKDLQSTVADLKALMEKNVKDQQETAVIEALQLREQGDKIRSLEDEVQNLREAQAASSASPPPYSDEDGISEQLRYYLTPAFIENDPLTVSEVVSWAEIARNERHPPMPRRATLNDHRRRIFHFLSTNIQSGRLSADILMAEAEAAEARAKMFQARQGDCIEAGIETARKSAEDARHLNANSDSFGWNICSPSSLPSATAKRLSSNNSASPSDVRTGGPRTGQSKRHFSSTCCSQIQCSPVQAFWGTRPSSYQNTIRKVSTGENVDEALPKEPSEPPESAFLRGADYRKRGFRKFDSQPLVRKHIATVPPTVSAAESPSLTGQSRTRHKALIRHISFEDSKRVHQQPLIHEDQSNIIGASPTSAQSPAPHQDAPDLLVPSQQQTPQVLPIRKTIPNKISDTVSEESHPQLPLRKVTLVTPRIHHTPLDTPRINHIKHDRDEPKPPKTLPADTGQLPLYRTYKIRKVNPGLTSPPRAPKDSANIRRGLAPRFRLKKFPYLRGGETFQPPVRFRFVKTDESPDSPNRSQGGWDALGEWDASLWEL